MKIIKCILMTLCLVTITTAGVEVHNSEIVAGVIQELLDTTRNALVKTEKSTKDITKSLQQNVVDVIHEGKEKLFGLKEEIKKKFDVDQVRVNCDIDLLKEVETFGKNIKAGLEVCAGNVFENCEEYRRKVRDDLMEIASFLDILKTTDNCFSAQSDKRRCYQDQINEYRNMNKEVTAGFDDIYNDTKENAIRVLNDLMECNQAVFKEARKQHDNLKEKLYTCTKLNSATPSTESQ